jgi:hypothetical protein
VATPWPNSATIMGITPVAKYLPRFVFIVTKWLNLLCQARRAA